MCRFLIKYNNQVLEILHLLHWVKPTVQKNIIRTSSLVSLILGKLLGVACDKQRDMQPKHFFVVTQACN